MGPVFLRTTTAAAAGTLQPLQTAPAWQQRFLAINSLISYVINSTTVNDTYEVTLGSSVEVQTSPIPGGGTVGIFLAFQDNVKTIVGAAADELAFTLVFAAAASAMLEVHLTPI